MVDPFSYFSLQPVLHDWCNKGRGMCYPVCKMVHIKEHLLLIKNSCPCSGGSWFVCVCVCVCVFIPTFKLTLHPTTLDLTTIILRTSISNMCIY